MGDRLGEARGLDELLHALPADPEEAADLRGPAPSTVDALSARRRPQTDAFGLAAEIEAALAVGPLSFGLLVERTRVPAIARAIAIGMLWQRLLTVDLAVPLEDTSPVALVRLEAA